VHNPFVSGHIAYLSWYSDGVRAVDISDPGNPVEIGSFVIGGDTHKSSESLAALRNSGHRDHVEDTGEPETFVWGVFVEDGLIFLSDEMTGLWIVRLKPAAVDEQPASSGKPLIESRSRRPSPR
jgi:hypothetical protein